jgi:hypothetical protein
MKSSKPLPAGKAIRCLKCRGQFTIRQPDPDTLISVPFQPPAKRLSYLTAWLVLGPVFVLLASGVVIAVYCLSLPDHSQVAQNNEDNFEFFGPPDDGDKSSGKQHGKKTGLKPNEKEKEKTKQKTKEKTKEEKTKEVAVKKAPAKFKEPAWVRKAVADGVKFLRGHVQGAGKWSTAPNPLGYAALTGLALLECDVPPTDSLVLAARKEVLDRDPSPHVTYELSLSILFLDRLGQKEDEDHIRRLAMRLVAGQNSDGGWGYNCPSLANADQQALLQFLQKQRLELDDLVRLPEFIISRKREKPDPIRTQKKPAEPRLQAKDLPPNLGGLPVVKQAKPGPGQPNGVNGRSDNSNSQFAMLALWVAQEHGVPMERTFNLVDQRFRNSQAPEGSWSYTPDIGSKPAMTCAGLLGLAVGHGSAQEVEVRSTEDAINGKGPSLQDPAIQKGLKFLAETVGHPMPTPPNIYLLWSVERVAVLYHLDTIGGKDWYSWGAKALLASQSEDGSWIAPNGYPGANSTNPTVDTCFALLFLKKANFVPGLTDDLRDYLRVRDPAQ